MSESEPKYGEAQEAAQQLWDDIQLICSGPGTFTAEQTDGYVVSRIAQTLAEIIHQRNASMFHIGEIWMERNQLLTRLQDLEAKFQALKSHHDELRVTLDLAIKNGNIKQLIEWMHANAPGEHE